MLLSCQVLTLCAYYPHCGKVPLVKLLMLSRIFSCKNEINTFTTPNKNMSSFTRSYRLGEGEKNFRMTKWDWNKFGFCLFLPFCSSAVPKLCGRSLIWTVTVQKVFNLLVCLLHNYCGKKKQTYIEWLISHWPKYLL